MSRSIRTVPGVLAAVLLAGGLAAGEQVIETETHRFEDVAEGVYFVSGTGAMVTPQQRDGRRDRRGRPWSSTPTSRRPRVGR